MFRQNPTYIILDYNLPVGEGKSTNDNPTKLLLPLLRTGS